MWKKISTCIEFIGACWFQSAIIVTIMVAIGMPITLHLVSIPLRTIVGLSPFSCLYALWIYEQEHNKDKQELLQRIRELECAKFKEL